MKKDWLFWVVMGLLDVAVLVVLVRGLSSQREEIPELRDILQTQRAIIVSDSIASRESQMKIDSLFILIKGLENEINIIDKQLKTIRNENVKSVNKYSGIVIERPKF
jgi:hypothetical protein